MTVMWEAPPPTLIKKTRESFLSLQNIEVVLKWSFLCTPNSNCKYSKTSHLFGEGIFALWLVFIKTHPGSFGYTLPSYVLHCGSQWRFVDWPGAFHSVADGNLSKQVDKLPRIPPLCLGTVESSRGPSNQNCMPTVAAKAALTLAPSSSLVFVSIFHFQRLFIPLPFVCAQSDLRGLLFQYSSCSLFSWRMFIPWIWKSADGDGFWLISSPSVESLSCSDPDASIRNAADTDKNASIGIGKYLIPCTNPIPCNLIQMSPS